MRYKTKEKHVEVEMFDYGTEDGFVKGNLVILKEAHMFPKEAGSKKYEGYLLRDEKILDGIFYDMELGIKSPWKPVVQTSEDLERISIGDYIVYEESGYKRILKQEQFFMDYEEEEDVV